MANTAADVYLRAFELEDYKLINAWRRDDAIYRLTAGDTHFVSSERDRKWVEDKIFENQHQVYLAICLREDESMIGYLSLVGIDYRNGHAEWGGIVIGDEKHRGHGYSTQAAYLLLEYAFDELGVQRISGSWLDDHKVSQFMARMMGFQQEGVLRRSVYKGGRHHDVVIMSMLKEEFEALRLTYAAESGQEV